MWYLLWKAQGRLPATATIKDGNKHAKATDGNEVPYGIPSWCSEIKQIKYHKHYAAKIATLTLTKIQEPLRAQKMSLIKIFSAEISDLTTLDLVSSATSSSNSW